MDTKTFSSLQTTQELVKEALSNSNEWQTIDRLVAICDEALSDPTRADLAGHFWDIHP